MLPRTSAIIPGSVSQGWDSQVRSGSAPVEQWGWAHFSSFLSSSVKWRECEALLMCVQQSFWAKMVSSLTCHLIFSVALWQVVLTKPSSSGTLSWWQTRTVPRRGERTSVWGFGGKGRLSLCPWVSLELCLWGSRLWLRPCCRLGRLSVKHTRTLQLDEDVLCVTYSPNQKLLAVSLLDCTVKVFYVDTLKVQWFWLGKSFLWPWNLGWSNVAVLF